MFSIYWENQLDTIILFINASNMKIPKMFEIGTPSYTQDTLKYDSTYKYTPVPSRITNVLFNLLSDCLALGENF